MIKILEEYEPQIEQGLYQKDNSLKDRYECEDLIQTLLGFFCPSFINAPNRNAVRNI